MSLSIGGDTECLLTDDFTQDCVAYTVGGIQTRIWLANRTNLSTQAVTRNTSNEVSNISFRAGRLKFFKYDIALDSGGALQGFVGLDNRGGASTHPVHTLNFSIQTVTQEILDRLDELIKSRDLVAIIESRQTKPADGSQGERNRFFLFGYPLGFYVTVADTNLGTAQGDFVGTALTITRGQTLPMAEINPDPALYPTFDDFLTYIQQNP